MIESDAQRRWWFATHPEYSWNRRGGSRSGKSRHADEFNRSRSRPKFAGPVFTARDYIDRIPMGGGGGGGSFAAPLRPMPVGGGGSVRTPAPKPPTPPTQPPAGKGGGPGEWVEVVRSRIGIVHQSKMSGQPIKQRDGKLYINEYEVNGVKFDDYRDGKLYEYKGPHGNLINENGVFKFWVRGAKRYPEDAKRQVRAARGIPVIWRIGKDQVKSFNRILKRTGVKVEP